MTAPFNMDYCYGGIIAFNRSGWSSEDLRIAEIAANVIGTQIEEAALRIELEAGIVGNERERLGRDLHDGLLQGLAASMMQLRALSAAAPSGLQNDLDNVRAILAEEASKIRTFVEETRNRERATTGLLSLTTEMGRVIAGLQKRWSCEVTMTIDPPDLACSLSTTRSVRHMVNEAVSNAVRHGRASHR